ncbi:MAG: transporter substrate-binding domain-containing protein, partial [Pseudonocardia sp.]|nr:transporter substrate-binding domain-containing protein [Pseudonocardia sp.]
CGRAASIGPAAAGRFTPATPGVLTVATYAVPITGFWEGSADAPTGGFEDGLAHALAQRFGLGAVQVVEVPFGRLIAGDVGGADVVLGGLTPTEQRRQVLDFSVPYLASRPAVLVRAGTAVPDVYTAKRLRWAVTAGSTNATALAEQIAPDPPVTANPNLAVSEAQLRAAAVDAMLLDLPDAMVRAAASGGALTVAATLPGDDDIAAAVPRGSPNAAAVDAAIRRFLSDGTLRALADRWLGRDYTSAISAIPLLRTGA